MRISPSLRELSLPRFALRREEAAASIGVSPTKFDEWCADGRMPKGRKVDGVVLWDTGEILEAWERLRDGRHAQKSVRWSCRVIETRLKDCIFDPDPNGNERYYVRKPGHRKIRITETFKDGEGAYPGLHEGLLRGAGGAGRKARRPKDPAREDILLAGGPVLSITKVQKLRSANPG